MAGVDALNLTQLPDQSAELDGVSLAGPEGGAGVPGVLAAAAHPAVPALAAPPRAGRHMRWRVGEVHPPGPQPGALDTGGGGGRVVHDRTAAGQTLVLRHTQLTARPCANSRPSTGLSLSLAGRPQPQTLEVLQAGHHLARLLGDGARPPPLAVPGRDLAQPCLLLLQLVQQQEVDGRVMVIRVLHERLKVYIS